MGGNATNVGAASGQDGLTSCTARGMKSSAPAVIFSTQVGCSCIELVPRKFPMKRLRMAALKGGGKERYPSILIEKPEHMTALRIFTKTLVSHWAKAVGGSVNAWTAKIFQCFAITCHENVPK